jgi:ABC-type cobalamin/Fe3+-siderophores transport system ATPase subunit
MSEPMFFYAVISDNVADADYEAIKSLHDGGAIGSHDSAVIDAPVLVLDEPTAHLDATTAERLMEDVLEAAADRTVLLITHRTEGLEHMDEIVELRAGAVIAC